MEEEKETKKYYTDSVKRAVYKYREKNRETYNTQLREYYKRMKENPEWVKARNDKIKANRDKKNEGKEPKPRGRPRKKGINPPNPLCDALESVPTPTP